MPRPTPIRNSFAALGVGVRGLPAPRLAALAAAAGVLLIFVFSTHLIWEDYLITYRYSENLARGQGLVYSPGERVYGFTSPLNALLPALFSFLCGKGSFLGPLWLFRCLSLAGFVAGLAATMAAFAPERTSSGRRKAAALLLALCAALEIKTAAFTMSGQEAGLVLGFLGAAFALGVFGLAEHWLLGGIAWAGLMYSRPDACVYIAALGLAGLVFPAGPRAAAWRATAKAAAVCAVLYLPWFLFTWGYYGSPIPHTVMAKYGLTESGLPGLHLFSKAAALFARAPLALCSGLAPIYDRMDLGNGTWPAWLHDATFFLEFAAVTYWLLPSRDRFGRMASLVSFVLCVYLDYVTLVSQFSPWYYPPLAFMTLVTLASAAATLAGAIRHRGLGSALLAGCFAGLLGLLGFVFFTSLRPLRFKQEVIEWSQRRVIGLWLKDQVRPGESVYLEPLGYIGYFSGAHMLDWPGLVSEQVPQARERLGPMTDDNWAKVAVELKPAWIVSRPESVELMKHNEYLNHHYRLVKVFDVTARLRALGPAVAAPGMYMNYFDAVFAVFRRTD